MKIDVIPFADAISRKNLAEKCVVVIDILRATSVMVTALQNGVRQIFPCLTVASAFEKAKAFRPGEFILCGERDAEKIEGFHLGNSPLQFTNSTVGGKTMLMTTSNGTKALFASIGAGEVLIGSFLNLDAVVRQIEEKERIVLACSGTLGKFSIDDGMAAAAIIDQITRKCNPRLNDLAQSVLLAYQAKNGELTELLKDCSHLNYLKKKGFEQDINYCLTKNKFDVVPFFDQQQQIVVAKRSD